MEKAVRTSPRSGSTMSLGACAATGTSSTGSSGISGLSAVSAGTGSGFSVSATGSSTRSGTVTG